MSEYYQQDELNIVIDPGYFSSQQTGGLGYDRYNIRQHYVTHHGLAQLPAGGPVGTPARIVRLVAPYSVKVVTWVLVKRCEVGEKPILPHWDTGDPNEVCIRGEVRVDMPAIDATGASFVWHVAGEYHYASGYAGRSQISGGSSPVITLPPEAFGLNEGDFSKDYLRSVSGGIKDGGSVFGGMVFDSALQ